MIHLKNISVYFLLFTFCFFSGCGSANKQTNKAKIYPAKIKLSDVFECDIKTTLIKNKDSIYISDALLVDSISAMDANQDSILDYIIKLEVKENVHVLCPNLKESRAVVFLTSYQGNYRKQIASFGGGFMEGFLIDGWQISYSTGQSIKCDNFLNFEVYEGEVYLSKAESGCAMPYSDIPVQDKEYEFEKRYLVENLRLEKIISDLQSVFYVEPSFLVAKKTFIYSQPILNQKSNAYFIKNDKVKALEQNEDWIKVSYKNDAKTGWVQIKDLTKVD